MAGNELVAQSYTIQPIMPSSSDRLGRCFSDSTTRGDVIANPSSLMGCVKLANHCVTMSQSCHGRSKHSARSFLSITMAPARVRPRGSGVVFGRRFTTWKPASPKTTPDPPSSPIPTRNTWPGAFPILRSADAEDLGTVLATEEPPVGRRSAVNFQTFRTSAGFRPRRSGR